MLSPFAIPPHPEAQAAAREVMERVHTYMDAHPESELHRQGKMFGVLVVDSRKTKDKRREYLAAFSAQLDGSYFHEGFVPPIYEMTAPPIGKDRADSQRLQRLLFAQYQLINGHGETKNLLDIFADEKPILTEEEFFGKSRKSSDNRPRTFLPPSGAGECCAPKLMQYAFAHDLKPVALAEFWVGAPSQREVRREGVFYPPCTGRCVPILRYMLTGIDLTQTPQEKAVEALCQQIETLYEDAYLMVVNKPSGLLSVPGKNEELSVETYLQAKAAHRLDQDTCGLLVLAKTPEVYKALQTYFQRRDVLKRYEAVIRPDERMNELPNEGMIDLPLIPNPYDRPRQMVDKEHGKPALTRYVIREWYADGTMRVDFYPLTGRTHQLRVHAAHPDGLNAPIVGDRLYGKEGVRLMLHAAEISFIHPITHEQMHFCCNLFAHMKNF